MATVTVDRFVETLTQHQLLEEEQLLELAHLQSEFPAPREFAEELVHRHWLSAYQLTQISQGNAAGLVLGQYILIDRLGEGGMGEVFKARQRNLERVVALKVIRKECLDNPRIIQRFQREIRAAGHLSHPNIVHAYDADQIDGQHYIAMEYIDGIDLAKLVKQSGPLSAPQACNYLRQAAVGLHHAHECGLIHRDVKPHNLIVTQNAPKSRASSAPLRRPALPGKSTSSASLSRPGLSENPWGLVKILDLGLARWNEDPNRAATHLTHLGTVMGSPDFIAPEQARNAHTSDIRADLYGLGCTLYFLLAGRIPFPNGTLTEKLLQHQVDDPEPIETVRRAEWAKYARRIGQTRVSRSVLRVPAEVAALVKMLMAKRPEDRPATAQDVADALADIQQRLATMKPAPDSTVVEDVAPAHPTLAEELTPTHIVNDVIILKPAAAVPDKFRFGRRWLTLAAVGGALCLGLVLAAVGGRSTDPKASPNRQDPVQRPGKGPVGGSSVNPASRPPPAEKKASQAPG